MALGDPILMMGADAAKGNLLIVLFAVTHEIGVRETSIVCSIGQNHYAKTMREAFESKFCFHCLFRIDACHHMDVREPRKIVNKNCRSDISISHAMPR